MATAGRKAAPKTKVRRKEKKNVVAGLRRHPRSAQRMPPAEAPPRLTHSESKGLIHNGPLHRPPHQEVPSPRD